MASTNKTQNIGLSLWELNDKPGMEDFNNDNKRLDTVLEDLKERLIIIKQDLREQSEAVNQQLGDINKTPTRYDVAQIITGDNYSVEGEYWITPFKQVHLNLLLSRTPGYAAGTVLGTMPEGFRPVKSTYCAGVFTNNVAGSYGASIVINPNGEIVVGISSDASSNYLVLNAAYLTE